MPYTLPNYRLKFIDSPADLPKAMQELRAEKVLSWGCDTEGTGLDPHTAKLRLFQLANQEVAYVFDIFKLPTALDEIKRYLEEIKGEITLIWQNASFDIQMLWSAGIDLCGHRLYDTQLAGTVVGIGLFDRFNLVALAERYLGYGVDKEEQRSDWSIWDLTVGQIKYAADDAVVTHALAPIIHAEVKLLEQQKVLDLEHRCLPAVASMEWYGTYVDLDKMSAIQPHYEDLAETAKTKLLSQFKGRHVRHNLEGELLDEGICLTSSSQLKRGFRLLKVPNPDKKAEDKLLPSTGKNVLKLLDMVKYPIIADLLEYRKSNTLLTKFIYPLPNMVNKVTGKLHTHFRQIVTTGRLSSSKPNLNQLPRADGTEFTLRTTFCAPEGFKLCQADYSQIEPRIIAELLALMFGDYTAVNEFIDGKDPYCALGSALMEQSYEEFMLLKESNPKFWKSKRTLSKALKLGLNYAMMHHRLMNYVKTDFGLSLTLKEAKENREAYLRIYPGLAKYHEYYSDKTRLVAYSMPPFKRIRRWSEFPGVSGICNMPVQSTAADIQKQALADIFWELHAMGYSPTQSHDIQLTLSIHDETVLLARIELADMAHALQVRCMIDAAKLVLKICPVDVDGGVIDNLSQKA